MTLPHQAAPAECHPAVTGPHTTNSYTVGPHSFPPPSRNRWSKRRTTKDFTTIGSKSFHRLIYGQGRRAALTFWTQIRMDILCDRVCGSEPLPSHHTIGTVDLSANSCCTFLPLSSGHCTELRHCGFGKGQQNWGHIQDTGWWCFGPFVEGVLLLTHRVHQPKRP